MREILFRGKSLETGEWVEGSLVHRTKFYGDPDDRYFIIYNGEFHCDYYDVVEVDPNTVGQYTGLCDKNGKKIFEGDVLQTRRYETYTEKLKGYYGYDDEGYPQELPGYTGSMTVHRQRANDNYRAVVRFDSKRGFYINGASVCVDAICNTVVGNIHDNPELLEVEI